MSVNRLVFVSNLSLFSVIILLIFRFLELFCIWLLAFIFIERLLLVLKLYRVFDAIFLVNSLHIRMFGHLDRRLPFFCSVFSKLGFLAREELSLLVGLKSIFRENIKDIRFDLIKGRFSIKSVHRGLVYEAVGLTRIINHIQYIPLL